MEKQIHKAACNGCPSTKGLDEESAEISTYPKELIAREYLFVCYKRPDKLCKGLCDNMQIDQEYLDKLSFKTITKLTKHQQKIVDILKKGECQIYSSPYFNHQKIYSTMMDNDNIDSLFVFSKSTLNSLISKGVIKPNIAIKSTYILS